ncbi:MAG: class I SAM-dependent methyltransferase [Thermoplasmata archaeon]|nr:class I SAM-dependent methyltransferase [Thermoplasmata archaeon]
MNPDQSGPHRQLQRQSSWLRESLEWVITNRIGAGAPGRRDLSGLDVGCGPGIVMNMLRPQFSSVGIDMDDAMVHACRARGLDAAQALAEDLPFKDRAFDVVYCSWLLLWVKDPARVVAEMKRVSKEWVFCMAEPDYGARIDYPDDLSELGAILAEGIRRDGGDPFIGRRLRQVFDSCGLEPEIGIHPGIWDIARLRKEAEGEWVFIRMTAGEVAESSRLEALMDTWYEALAAGTLIQFNPVFYALARVPQKA